MVFKLIKKCQDNLFFKLRQYSVVVKSTAWAQIPALPLSSYLALSKLFVFNLCFNFYCKMRKIFMS